MHRPDGQLVIVDTPGIHRPRTLLGERLNTLVAVDARRRRRDRVLRAGRPRRSGPGDRFITEQLDEYPRAKKVAIVTKTDAASRKPGSPSSCSRSTSCASGPRSSRSRRRRGSSSTCSPTSCSRSCPYRARRSTRRRRRPTRTTDDRIAEIIREAALEGVRDELPHSIAVTVDDMVEREDKDLLEIYANLVVERDSQKGIIIGKGGSRLPRRRHASAGGDRAAARPQGATSRCT